MSADNETLNPETPESEENTNVTLREVTPFKKRQKLRQLVRKLAIAFAIIGPLIFVIAALGYRSGILDLGTSLGTLSRNVGPKVLMLGMVVSLASIVLSWLIQPRKGLIISLIALFIPVFGLFKLANIRNTVSSLPFIHDITTDPENPPAFTDAIVSVRNKVKRVNTLEYLEKKDKEGGTLISVLQSKHYPEIRPVRRSETPDVVYKEAEALVKTMGWEIVTLDAEGGVIEATDTTFWYGFKDDVIIRIQPSKNGGSLVDMRSVSRVGGSDLGANAARLNKLIAGLSK